MIDRIEVTVSKRLHSGELILIKFEGEVQKQQGSDEDVGVMLLEAEQAVNTGITRVHVFATVK